MIDDIDIKKFPFRISGYIPYSEAANDPITKRYLPYYDHFGIIPVDEHVYFISATGVYVDDGYRWLALGIRDLDLKVGEFKLLYSYPFSKPFPSYYGFKVVTVESVERRIEFILLYEGALIHIIESNGWTPKKIPLIEIPKGSALLFKQAKYNEYLYLLFRRFDKADEGPSNFSRTWFGVAKLQENKFDVKWGEVPGTIDHVHFDVSSPYIVLSFLSTDEKTVKMKGKEKSRYYVNFRGTHRVYIFDGKNWKKEVVE